MIRKDILSDDTIASQYYKGVTLLKNPEIHLWQDNDGLSVYDFFVSWHHSAMMLMTPPNERSRNAAHHGPSFFPWHRYFLLRFEEKLRAALNDDSFRMPYWDWTADAELPDPRMSALWDTSAAGQFEEGTWLVRLLQNPAQRDQLIRVDRSLKRNLGQSNSPSAFLPNLRQIRRIVSEQESYDRSPFNRYSLRSFRNFVERMHDNVHLWIGGDMGLSSSPNDPIFFLHHCNVDRIWAAWQKRHPISPYVPSQETPDDLALHRIDDPLHTFFEEALPVTPRTMLDHSQFYEYDTLEDLLVSQ